MTNIEIIKENLEEGEEFIQLVKVNSSTFFVIVKNNSSPAPFLIKGFDFKRKKWYDRFIACIDQQSVISCANLIIHKLNFR